MTRPVEEKRLLSTASPQNGLAALFKTGTSAWRKFQSSSYGSDLYCSFLSEKEGQALVKKLLRRDGVLFTRGLDSRLSKGIFLLIFQKLRCKVFKFGVLACADFKVGLFIGVGLPIILELGDKLSRKRMRSKRAYLRFHSGWEKDVWVCLKLWSAPKTARIAIGQEDYLGGKEGVVTIETEIPSFLQQGRLGLARRARAFAQKDPLWLLSTNMSLEKMSFMPSQWREHGQRYSGDNIYIHHKKFSGFFVGFIVNFKLPHKVLPLQVDSENRLKFTAPDVILLLVVPARIGQLGDIQDRSSWPSNRKSSSGIVKGGIHDLNEGCPVMQQEQEVKSSCLLGECMNGDRRGNQCTWHRQDFMQNQSAFTRAYILTKMLRFPFHQRPKEGGELCTGGLFGRASSWTRGERLA
nr:O-fucosyltransferase 20 [Ipomoea batatas]